MSDEFEDLDDLDLPKKGTSPGLLAAILGLVVLVGGGFMWHYYQQLGNIKPLIGEDGGLQYSEMLVTGDAVMLRSNPEGSSGGQALSKNAKLTLLAKRGEFYKARTATGGEGWVGVSDVIPMYMLGGQDVRDEFDPLYNPDRYMDVKNANWMQLDLQNTQQTVFNFMLKNQSQYDMADIILLATIKDSRGKELERLEIPIEGIIPAWEQSMVGTLGPESDDEEAGKRLITNYTFEKLAEEDQDLQLRFSDGAEVEMKTADFTEANIDILEVRAVPN